MTDNANFDAQNIFKDILQQHMLKRGWFFINTGEISDADYENIRNLNDNDLDDFMIQHTFTHDKDIINKTADYNNKREEIIRAAYGSHCEGDYELSVPIFMIQSIGMATELLKKCGANSDIADVLTYISSFGCNKEYMSVGEMKVYDMMHGIDIKYDTLTNSCKGIVLFDFLNKLHDILSV